MKVLMAAVAALGILASEASAVATRAPAPIATAAQKSGPQRAAVWIRFADGRLYAGVISWYGSPEFIDWATSVVMIEDMGVMRKVSNWWLTGATVTTRVTFVPF